MTLHLPEPVQNAVARFWVLLDSETVRLFVWPFYLALQAWAIYGIFFAAPIEFVQAVMGAFAYDLWLWMCLAGTSSVLTGLALRRGGTPVAQMSWPMLYRDYLGLWMQLGGHLCMFLVLAVYEVSAIRGAHWGQAAFSIFALAPYVLGCLFLALQTARKLWHGERLHRAIDTTEDES